MSHVQIITLYLWGYLKMFLSCEVILKLRREDEISTVNSDLATENLYNCDKNFLSSSREPLKQQGAQILLWVCVYSTIYQCFVKHLGFPQPCFCFAIVLQGIMRHRKSPRQTAKLIALDTRVLGTHKKVILFGEDRLRCCVCLCVSLNQSSSQSDFQSVCFPVSQSFIQSISQSASLSSRQSVFESVIQSVSHPVSQSSRQPVIQSASQSVSSSYSPSVSHPVGQSSRQSVIQVVIQSVS